MPIITMPLPPRSRPAARLTLAMVLLTAAFIALFSLFVVARRTQVVERPGALVKLAVGTIS